MRSVHDNPPEHRASQRARASSFYRVGESRDIAVRACRTCDDVEECEVDSFWGGIIAHAPGRRCATLSTDKRTKNTLPMISCVRSPAATCTTTCSTATSPRSLQHPHDIMAGNTEPKIEPIIALDGVT
ncbi:hypothetical protein ACLOJK_025497 [Asimina triloba]